MTSSSKSSKATPSGQVGGLDTSIHPRPREQQTARRDALTRVRHDLRSHVHSVLGYADLLANPTYGSLGPEQARFLGHVRAAATQLEELVDACIELSCPPPESARLPTRTVPLSAALKHVQAGLSAAPMVCSLEVASAIAAHPCAHELPLLLRALRSLALVVTREGALPCALRAFARTPSRPIVELWAGAQRDGVVWSSLDALEADIGNRDFVRLKLGEALLSRIGIYLTVAAELDGCQLCFV